MKIKVIGKYGRYAPFNAATNCYLIQSESGKNIVLDLGSGGLSGLQKYIDIKDIDMVIITHLHFDHASDLGVLAYSLGYLGLNKLKVYMPETPEILKECFVTNQFDITYINDKLRFNVDSIDFNFAKSPHPVETYSVIMTEKNKKLVYTSDCSMAGIIKSNTAGANVVIGDSCILQENHKIGAPHITVKELAENVPADCKLYLAHLTFGQENEILKEAKTFHPNAEIIKDFEL